MRYYYNLIQNLEFWMDVKNLKTAIYTRVSTEDQAKEGFSLDAQLDKLRSYCKARDWTISDEYIDDGYTGRNVKRPAYSRMLEEMDKWDILLVIKMDRIHRNSKNFMLMMEDLKKHGKEFVSMTESLDTSTAMGRFVMDIIQRIAQLESEQIGERVYIGMEQKARTNGGILGFNIPYGYNYVNGNLIINQDEAKYVKRIFNQYLKGMSMKKISNELNSKNIPTKLNKKWGPQTISLILKNPIYCGFLHWQDYLNPSNHDPIIINKIFNEVQKIIKNRNLKTKHNSKIFIIPD
jgi:DNA invertase Pin-like site-specific DNA recombinase